MRACASVCGCVRACMCTCLYACLCPYMCAYVPACVCLCVWVGELTWSAETWLGAQLARDRERQESMARCNCHTPNSNVTLCTSIVLWVLSNVQGVTRRRRRCVGALVQSILQSTGLVTTQKLHSTHFIHHTHMVSSCKVHRHYRNCKDTQLLVSIGHVTVCQSDPIQTHKIMQCTVHKLAFSIIKFQLSCITNSWSWKD